MNQSRACQIKPGVGMFPAQDAGYNKRRKYQSRLRLTNTIMKFVIRPRSGDRLYSVRCVNTEQKVKWTLMSLLLTAMAVFLGYGLGVKYGHKDIVVRWQQDIHTQQMKLITLREQSEANIEALTQKIAYFQAHINRLNAFGHKLSAMAELEDAEIDFTQPPGLGGPKLLSDQQNEQILAGMEDVLIELTRDLQAQENKLFLLDTLLTEKNFNKQALPQGRPIEKGWLSSHYGTRVDPFSGKQEFHRGIDFAGQSGSNVIAVAAGIVTAAEDRNAYGNLIEIDHGNGYVTRYGHNKSMEVEVGQSVKKGQVIAKMGSTGRSTGPHVHFEVLKNGTAINPTKFIQSARE